jgi:hypothetical protein
MVLQIIVMQHVVVRYDRIVEMLFLKLEKYVMMGMLIIPMVVQQLVYILVYLIMTVMMQISVMVLKHVILRPIHVQAERR